MQRPIVSFGYEDSHFFREKRNYCYSLSHGENKSLFPTLISFIYSFIYFLFTKAGDLDYPPLHIQIQSRMKKYLPHISLFTPSNDKNILLNCPQLNTTLDLFKRWMTLASHSMQTFLSRNARVSCLSLGRSVAWREKKAAWETRLAITIG